MFRKPGLVTRPALEYVGIPVQEAMRRAKHFFPSIALTFFGAISCRPPHIDKEPAYRNATLFLVSIVDHESDTAENSRKSG